MLASGVTLAGKVRVGRGAYLGQRATVRQEIRIGARSLVGMGSVVIEDVAPNTVVAGNPARVLRDSNDVHRPGSGMGTGEFRRLQERYKLAPGCDPLARPCGQGHDRERDVLPAARAAPAGDRLRL